MLNEMMDNYLCKFSLQMKLNIIRRNSKGIHIKYSCVVKVNGIICLLPVTVIENRSSIISVIFIYSLKIFKLS